MAIPTSKDAAPPSRQFSRLRLLWRFAKAYPGHLTAALIALVIAAGSTLAVPRGLQLVVDRGFHAGADPSVIAPYFWALLVVVAVQGLATGVRFLLRQLDRRARRRRPAHDRPAPSAVRSTPPSSRTTGRRRSPAG